MTSRLLNLLSTILLSILIVSFVNPGESFAGKKCSSKAATKVGGCSQG
ncbi:MAG: hypothetical protein WA702_06340 [Bradyrhizobium sp.]|jgi:hypothetical protein